MAALRQPVHKKILLSACIVNVHLSSNTNYAHMYKLIVLFAIVLCSSCATKSFQADKRQLIAKNVIREKIGEARDYDILSFKEDTVAAADGKQALQYTLEVSYKDSTGALQKSKGLVLFTPEGNQVISSTVSPE